MIEGAGSKGSNFLSVVGVNEDCKVAEDFVGGDIRTRPSSIPMPPPASGARQQFGHRE